MGNGIILKVAVGVCCAFAVFALASCAPRHAAVGDTGAAQDAPAHVDSPGEARTVALIGDTHGAEELVESALDADGYAVILMAPGDADDAPAARIQAVRDAVARNVGVIIVSGVDASKDEGQWRVALRLARDAGIPVVLLNPVEVPDDEELYAAVFTVNDRMMDAQPVGEALGKVLDDEPHDKDILVTTLH